MPPPNELSISLIISSTCPSSGTSDICEGPVSGPTFEFNLFSGVHRSLWRSGTSSRPQATASTCSSTDPPSFLWASPSVFRLQFSELIACFCSLLAVLSILSSVSFFCFVSSPLTSLSTFLTSSFFHRLDNGLHRPRLLPRAHWRPSPSGHPFFNSLFFSLSLPCHRASPS